MVTKPPDTTATPAGAAEPAVVPLRKNKDFQALWTSDAFAAVAKETAEFAYPLLILATTGSALFAGMVASIQLVVASLVSISAGRFADRFDRKRLLMTCNLTRVGLLGLFAGLIFAGWVNLPVILLIACASAVFLSISQPAALAAIKALVPPQQVTAAVSQVQIRFFGATLLGPPIGGFLFGVSRAFPYLGAAVSFLVSSALLVFVRKPTQAVETLADEGKRHAKDGFRLIRREPILLWMIVWIMGSNMVFNHTGVFIALAATGHLEGSETAMIGVSVAFGGAGGLLGSFVAAWVLKHVSPTAIMAAAALVGPIAALLLAFVPNLITMGIIVGVVFLRGPIVSALSLAYVSALAPDKMHGRVLGAVFFLSMIVQPIGIFSLGAIFDAGGPSAVFTTVCVVTTLIALTMLTPTMRRLPRPENLKEATA